MPVRLRIALHGNRNERIFHIVAAHAGKARNAKPIETLGVFSPRADPLTREKTVEWSVERIRYWLGVGAQPSDTVLGLLERGGVVPRSPKPWDPTPNFAPTPQYPAPSPVFRYEIAKASSPPQERKKKDRAAKERQLEITRQWTHDLLVLRNGAKGGTPVLRPRKDRVQMKGEGQETPFKAPAPSEPRPQPAQETMT